MLRYVLKSDSVILITNDKDINMIQDRDPVTGKPFATKEDTIEWAINYAKEMGQTIIVSEENIDEPTAVELLKKELTTFKQENEVLKGCVMELASIIYS